MGTSIDVRVCACGREAVDKPYTVVYKKGSAEDRPV